MLWSAARLEVPCPACGKKIAPGSRIKLVQVGIIEPVGGAGLYKDFLTLHKPEPLRIEHEVCP